MLNDTSCVSFRCQQLWQSVSIWRPGNESGLVHLDLFLGAWGILSSTANLQLIYGHCWAYLGEDRHDQQYILKANSKFFCVVHSKPDFDQSELSLVSLLYWSLDWTIPQSKWRLKKKVQWEENICFSGQIRDFPPSVIIVFALPELRVSGESVRQHYRPCSSSTPSSCLQLPNHAAFWSSVQTDKCTHTLAAAAKIRRTAHWMQLKRSAVIEVFSRSAKVLRGFSP